MIAVACSRIPMVENFVLTPLAGAALQIELDFFSPDERRSLADGYGMFLGNVVHIFAYSEVETRVAVVVQGG